MLCNYDFRSQRKRGRRRILITYWGRIRIWSLRIGNRRGKYVERRWERRSPPLEVEQVEQENENDGKEYRDWEYESLVKFKLKFLGIQMRGGGWSFWKWNPHHHLKSSDTDKPPATVICTIQKQVYGTYY